MRSSGRVLKGDFGLAKALKGDSGESYELMSRVAGSYGYIAPEYAYTLKVTEKSNVYRYGVVLMELVTGKRPNDPSISEGNDLVKWVTEVLLSSPGRDGSDQLAQLIDPKMNPLTNDLEEIRKVLHVAVACTVAFPMNRPSMRKVVQILKDHTVTHPK
ncbi:hypothetical protein Dimus_017578 [Dionaea muscipula]